jgi:hypothetical protein
MTHSLGRVDRGQPDLRGQDGLHETQELLEYRTEPKDGQYISVCCQAKVEKR